ncbi:MAG: MCE family protein [Methylococcaceae bacterium]|nr:MAG: MCE family protein [Methylococcaceae bacterium]
MFKFLLMLLGAASITLAGCLAQTLPLNIRFERLDGLKAGDAVVLRGQTVGQVDAIAYNPSGVFLAQIHIDTAYREAATTATRFYLAGNPEQPGGKRIELEHAGGGQPLADGAMVDGTMRGAGNGLLPFDEFFRDMGAGLRQFGGQVQQLRQGMEQLPDSEEAKKLADEWQRLMEQIEQTGKSAEKDLEPRLRRQMEDWSQRLRQLEEKSK